MGVGGPAPGSAALPPGLLKPVPLLTELRRILARSRIRDDDSVCGERETKSIGGENVTAPHWETICADKSVATSGEGFRESTKRVSGYVMDLERLQSFCLRPEKRGGNT